MRFVVDVSLSPAWIPVLTSGRHDALHWSTLGPLNAPDLEIFAWAAENERAVFTHDLDFGDILAATGARIPSVVQLREHDIDPARIGPSVLAALKQFESEIEAGAIITIDLRRARARLLPIARRS